MTELIGANPQFIRNGGFISAREQELLGQKLVVIAGVGGDGGHLAEATARQGVRRFRFADPESFEVENINRQYGADYTTIGQNKAEVVAKKIQAINPHAEIEVFREGITLENVGDFVHGSDLVLDETEYTRPELGVGLARAARLARVPVMMALNVGDGARFVAFRPEKGPTLESWLGLDEHMPLNEIAQQKVPLERWIGRLPSYANTDELEKLERGEMSAPSLATGVFLAAGLTATHARDYLLSTDNPVRGRDIVWAPKMISFDAKEGMKVIKYSHARFVASALRAYVRTRRGVNPPLAA